METRRCVLQWKYVYDLCEDFVVRCWVSLKELVRKLLDSADASSGTASLSPIKGRSVAWPVEIPFPGSSNINSDIGTFILAW